MNKKSDGELWTEASRGSGDSFGTLFERHASSIYNYCFRRTGDWTVAEDLTSAVFLEAWRRRQEVKLFGEELLPWLYGVATLLIRNYRRSLRRYDAVLRRLPTPEPAYEFGEDLISRIDDEHRMKAILPLLRKLPQHEQDVLALCSWMGLTYERTALALKVPVGTVRSRLARARTHIRHLVANAEHIAPPQRSPDGRLT